PCVSCERSRSWRVVLLLECSRILLDAPPPTANYTLSLHDALPISPAHSRYTNINWSRCIWRSRPIARCFTAAKRSREKSRPDARSEEHTSELQSRRELVCRLLLEKKKAKALRVLVDDAEADLERRA